MQGTNVLFGQIAVVFGIVIAGVWSATQWTAAALGYQLRLGSPWFDFLGTPVYHPWRLFEWWFLYDAYAPQVFAHGGAIAAGSGLLATGVAIGMAVWRSRLARRVTTYGSARWAERAEIDKAGLTKAAGVFLGRLVSSGGAYLRHEGPEHVMAFAPTRSGKGVGLVVPTLADLAGLGRDPRHQGRELEHHRWLALALLALPAVQPDRCEVGGLQPAA
jgi:type IV secretion system protein VirD4